MRQYYHIVAAVQITLPDPDWMAIGEFLGSNYNINIEVKPDPDKPESCIMDIFLNGPDKTYGPYEPGDWLVNSAPNKFHFVRNKNFRIFYQQMPTAIAGQGGKNQQQRNIRWIQILEKYIARKTQISWQK